jgi:hypothetical protein
MPINMDPTKKRRRQASVQNQNQQTPTPSAQKQFGEETEEDRIKALADAEKKNLWDATEVIDMDRF